MKFRTYKLSLSGTEVEELKELGSIGEYLSIVLAPFNFFNSLISAVHFTILVWILSILPVVGLRMMRVVCFFPNNSPLKFSTLPN